MNKQEIVLEMKCVGTRLDGIAKTGLAIEQAVSKGEYSAETYMPSLTLLADSLIECNERFRNLV